MPKARRSSYTMAFRIKVVAEAEAVEKRSEIALDYELNHGATLETRPGDYSFWRAYDVCKTCKNEPFHSQVSRTRRASDGVVFTAERPNILFVM